MTTSSEHDVIVIGSGPGGLSAAAGLARAGQRVLVLEQHFAPGGNAQTFLRRKHFAFDVGIHALDDCGPEGITPRILADLGASIDFDPLDTEAFDVLRFRDRQFLVPVGWTAYGKALADAFPQEKEKISVYIDYMRSIVERVGMGRTFIRLILLKRPSRVLEPLLRGDPSYLERLRQRHPSGSSAALEQKMGKDFSQCTLLNVFDILKIDTPLRHVLGGQNLLYGTSWGRASAAMHAIVIDRYLQGTYYPRGGAHTLINALVQSIEDAGGTVRCRAEVKRILIEKGSATGVELASGQVIRAKAVISNADTRHTFLDLIDPADIERPTRESARQKTMALPLFVTYLAIKRDPETLDLRNANYWLFPENDLEAQYEACLAGRLPERPMVYVSIASLKERRPGTIAPSGYTNLQLMAIAPPHPSSWGAAEHAPRKRYRHGAAYRTAKQCYADRMLSVVSDMLPELLAEKNDKAIAWQESATPLTQARFTHSSLGTGYGLDHTPGQFLTGRFPIVSTIPGLFCVGASTLFGHGITGALLSGRACVQAVLGLRTAGED